MSVVNKYNKGNLFDVETEGFKFLKLSKIYNKKTPDKVFNVRGLQVFDTRYGESATVILDDCFVNLPSHMLQTIKAMLQDDELIEKINDGKIGFTIREYEDTKHGAGKCYGVTWVEEK